MASFDAVIEKACKDVEIPGAVLFASSADGKFRYGKAFGVRSLKDLTPMPIDATMWLASCTKFMTTIAAMQCVEKGLLNLDTDVVGILPELKGREILKGFDEAGKPILIPNTKAITLRHLLTHQSGFSYDVFNPLLMKYQATRGVKVGLGISRSIVESYDFPLLFEPGESWEYSAGIDWAGEMVMRVTNMSLEEYMAQNIWQPLGMKYVTFFPAKTPDVKSRLVDMSQRDSPVTMFGTAQNPDAKLEYTDKTIWAFDSVVGCHGGAGGYGAPLDYAKMVHSICADDGKLLKSETIAEMFKPQLTDAARAKINELNRIPELNRVYGGSPMDVTLDWGIGGIMNLDAYPGRSAGTIAWGGYPNLLWWCDRSAGISGIIGTQINPPGDLKVENLFKEWTKECYAKAGIKEKL